jgi:DNA transposition AAA+ family ATPase
MLLLYKLGWIKAAAHSRIADAKVVDLLKEQRTRLIAIDEIHTILTIAGKARRDTLDALRYLMSEANIPMVVAGIDRAAAILSEDEELSSRAIILKLTPWKPGQELQQHIYDIADAMGFPNPAAFAEPEMSQLIYEAATGVLGNIKKLMHWTSKAAKVRGALMPNRDDVLKAISRFPAYVR